MDIGFDALAYFDVGSLSKRVEAVEGSSTEWIVWVAGCQVKPTMKMLPGMTKRLSMMTGGLRWC